MILAATTILLAAPLKGQGKPVIYQCPPNQKLVVMFSPAGSGGAAGNVQLTLPDQRTITLPQVPAASGAKYSDGNFTFWSKGNTALLEQNERLLLRDCVTFPDN